MGDRSTERVQSADKAGSAGTAPAPAGTLLHRALRPGAQRLLQKSDVILAGLLAALLVPAWLLPERYWPALCRRLARQPRLTDPRALARNAANIQAGLGEPDPRRAEVIALELEAGIRELHLQDLRAWRPGSGWPGGWRPAVTLEGEAHLLQALAEGRGAILWVAHQVFSNVTPKLALRGRGHRIVHLSSVEHGDAKSRLGIALLNPVRCIPESRHVAARIVVDRSAPAKAVQRLARALKAGDVVTIGAVATEGASLMEMPFLGGRAILAPGAPRLSMQTGAPLLPLFAVRDPARGYRVIIEAPIAPPAAASADERSLAAAAEFLRRAEPWVRQFPGQWRGWNKWAR